MVEQIQALFKERFGRVCEVTVKSPARINLIGEHTDYNGGRSMPGAIAQSICLALGVNDLGIVRAYSMNLGEEFELSMAALHRVEEPTWYNYLSGVLQYLKLQGYIIPGVDVVFGGDIPIGAGLSSSAALSCGFGAGVDALGGFGLDKLVIAKAAQWAEHHYVGTLCGLMDQIANLYSIPDHAFILDHQTLGITQIPFGSSTAGYLLMNTMVKHELANTAYNDRRRVCEAAVKVIQATGRECRYVSDFKNVPQEVLKLLLDDEAQRLVKFLLEENERVDRFADCIRKGMLEEAGSLLYQSHQGLSEEYKVSCAEADTLVDMAKQTEGVLGARMMGGGFGGCVLLMVTPKNPESIVSRISSGYSARFGINPEVYLVNLGGGTQVFRH
jgi:galactokinase